MIENIEKLQKSLDEDIKLQTVVREQNTKTFRRITVIFGGMFIVVICALSSMIYLMIKPVAGEYEYKQLKQIQNSMLIQRSLMNDDREDIERARLQVLQMQKNQLKQDTLSLKLKTH